MDKEKINDINRQENIEKSKEFGKSTIEWPVQEEKEEEMRNFLGKFKKNIYPKIEREDLEEEIIETGNAIVNMLKGKELTYVDAYATLEYVYRTLKVMSEYTHL